MSSSAKTPSRPRAFLVSTARTAEAERLFHALSPALATLGTIRRVANPESSLLFIASEAEAAGHTPIQVAIGPLDSCYLTPAVPTLLIPIWDYPHIPTTDVNYNGRTNWARIAGRADAVLAPSTFIADTFRHAQVPVPVDVVNPPAPQDWLELPTWGERMPVSLTVPHVIWGGETGDDADDEEIVLRGPARRQKVSAGRRAIRRVKPYLSNATIEKLDRYRESLSPLIQPNPAKMAAGVGKVCYRTLVRPWISDGVRTRLKSAAVRVGRKHTAHAHHMASDRLPAAELTLSGLVYSAVVDYREPIRDEISLITAFLHAFSDRPDVTLVLRLETTHEREVSDLARLHSVCRSTGKTLQCRIVVVLGPVAESDRVGIARATSYFVETSQTCGHSLDMIESLAAGRPVIAPGHSAYAEWIDERVGFSASTTTEPTFWPIDPTRTHTTTWERVIWSDLHAKLVDSAAVVAGSPRHYEELSSAARRLYRERANQEAVARQIGRAIDRIKHHTPGAFTWVA